MRNDRTRWNERYRTRDYSEAPSDILTRFYHLAPPGRALDIASGMGRNALFLAQKGFEVEAVDVSDVAVKALGGRHPRIHAACQDLDAVDIESRHYQLIVNVRYLNRRLFPLIIEGLRPDGVLIFETYIEKPEYEGRPTRRDYLLRENELLHGFLSLQIVYYEEKRGTGSMGPFRTASLVARKKA